MTKETSSLPYATFDETPRSPKCACVERRTLMVFLAYVAFATTIATTYSFLIAHSPAAGGSKAEWQNVKLANCLLLPGWLLLGAGSATLVWNCGFASHERAGALGVQVVLLLLGSISTISGLIFSLVSFVGAILFQTTDSDFIQILGGTALAFHTSVMAIACGFLAIAFLISSAIALVLTICKNCKPCGQ